MSSKIKLLRELKQDEKLAPQARVIYDVLHGIGIGKEIERSELDKQVEDTGKLQTRQPVSRIVGYYQKPMKEDGLIEVIKAAPAPAPKAEKAAKPEKSPAEAPAKPEKPTKVA